MNQHQLNKAIEQFIAEKDASGGEYSPSDVAYIQQYEGSGGLASKGARGMELLYEFYTPDYVCDLMHDLAVSYGYDGGNILEPSVGTGRIIRPYPDKSKVTAFETNPVSARICQITYPQATVYNYYFEKAFMQPPRFTTRIRNDLTWLSGRNGLTWLSGFPFSLVIGNPPFGKYNSLYSSYFKNPKMKQVELFFMYYGLKLLRPNGLMIYLTSSNFLRNGLTYNPEKELIGGLADLMDAYRLPPVFPKSGVATDILVFKRRP